MTMMLPAFFTDNLWFIVLVTLAAAFPLAWIAEAVFGDRAFGLIGNYVFLMTGALGGASWMMLSVGSATRVMQNPELPFFAAAGGAAALILVAAGIKRLMRE